MHPHSPKKTSPFLDKLPEHVILACSEQKDLWESVSETFAAHHPNDTVELMKADWPDHSEPSVPHAYALGVQYIIDPLLYAQYAEGNPEIMQKHDITTILRGPALTVLGAPNCKHIRLILVQSANAQNFFNAFGSHAYQKKVHLRYETTLAVSFLSYLNLHIMNTEHLKP